jgi:nicotinamidase-related amidase
VPVDLKALLDPTHTAVLTMELQRGVVGDLSPMRELADAIAERNVVDNAASIVRAARRAGATIVHCVAHHDDSSPRNAPLLRAIAKNGDHLVAESDAAALVPELGPEPTDLISARKHGLTPFPGTDLDSLLRNRAITTVVATGASLNVGIAGLAMVAVDLGYEVVVATDAVAGIPTEYGDAVLANTIPALATRATTDEIVAVWAP